MSDEGQATILACLLFVRDAGGITEEEYTTAYNAFNQALETEWMYKELCK